MSDTFSYSRDPFSGQFAALDLAFNEVEKPTVAPKRCVYEGIDYEPSNDPTPEEIIDLAWLEACEAVELSNEGNIDHADSPFFTHPRADEGTGWCPGLIDDSGYAVFVWTDPDLGCKHHRVFDHAEAPTSVVKRTFAVDQPEEDYDNFGFRPGVRYNRPLNFEQADLRADRYYQNVGAKKPARYRIDGCQRRRKCLRDRRFGNRQHFELDRDFYADWQDAWETMLAEADRSAIPEFDPSFVGLSEEEAGDYEAEMLREEAWYQAELERLLWDNYEEPDYSYLFRSQTTLDQLKEVHERHLFPENFEEPEPYRYSFFDHGHYDDWDDSWYYDQYYEQFDDWDDPYFDEPEHVDPKQTAVDEESFWYDLADNDNEVMRSPSFVGNDASFRRGRRQRRHFRLRDWYEEGVRCG